VTTPVRASVQTGADTRGVTPANLARKGDPIGLTAEAGAGGLPTLRAWARRAGSGRVEVYTRPTRTRGYRDHVEYKSRVQVPVVIDGREVGRIAVADLLP
jgi:hypothetical protein